EVRDHDPRGAGQTTSDLRHGIGVPATKNGTITRGGNELRQLGSDAARSARNQGGPLWHSLFFLLEAPVVVFDELADLVRHVQQLVPLLAVEGDGEPSEPVHGKRALLAHLE